MNELRAALELARWRITSGGLYLSPATREAIAADLEAIERAALPAPADEEERLLNEPTDDEVREYRLDAQDAENRALNYAEWRAHRGIRTETGMALLMSLKAEPGDPDWEMVAGIEREAASHVAASAPPASPDPGLLPVVLAAWELNATMPDAGDGDPLSDLDDSIGALAERLGIAPNAPLDELRAVLAAAPSEVDTGRFSDD